MLERATLKHGIKIRFTHDTLEGLLCAELQNGHSPSINLITFFNSLSLRIPLDFIEKHKTDKLNHLQDTADNLIETMLTFADPLTSPTDIEDCMKWIDDIDNHLPLEDELQPNNAIDYITSQLYCEQTHPMDIIAKHAWDAWEFKF